MSTHITRWPLRHNTNGHYISTRAQKNQQTSVCTRRQFTVCIQGVHVRKSDVKMRLSRDYSLSRVHKESDECKSNKCVQSGSKDRRSGVQLPAISGTLVIDRSRSLYCDASTVSAHTFTRAAAGRECCSHLSVATGPLFPSYLSYFHTRTNSHTLAYRH